MPATYAYGRIATTPGYRGPIPPARRPIQPADPALHPGPKRPGEPPDGRAAPDRVGSALQTAEFPERHDLLAHVSAHTDDSERINRPKAAFMADLVPLAVEVAGTAAVQEWTALSARPRTQDTRASAARAEAAAEARSAAAVPVPIGSERC